MREKWLKSSPRPEHHPSGREPDFWLVGLVVDVEPVSVVTQPEIGHLGGESPVEQHIPAGQVAVDVCEQAHLFVFIIENWSGWP